MLQAFAVQLGAIGWTDTPSMMEWLASNWAAFSGVLACLLKI
jgi:hypothetical protein